MLRLRKENKEASNSWQNLDTSAEVITSELCSEEEVKFHQQKKGVQELQKDSCKNVKGH